MSSSETPCSGDEMLEPISPTKEVEMESISATISPGISVIRDDAKDGSVKKQGESLAETLDSESNKCILSPLCLPEPSKVNDALAKSNTVRAVYASAGLDSMYPANETPCVLCEQLYTNISEKSIHDEYLCHLIVEHKLVIADVKLIADLRKYSIYWKKRFQEESIKKFCAMIKTNSGETDIHASEMYYLLCDAVAEDRVLREELQISRLKELIEVQSKERADTNFEKMCLFCTKFFIGNRNDLFIHMNECHNFNVGHPYNLVFIDDFLHDIEQKLINLECLYCDKVFKDRATLIEHMRKKSHRRLNPKNKSYDKYYIINYLELGKNWESLQNEPDHLDNGDEWSGWDDEAGQTVVCFFCNSQFATQDKLFEHMTESHDFNYVALRKDMNLSFYQQIKMINYIRRTALTLKKSDQDKNPEKPDDPVEEDTNKYAAAIKECISSSTKWNQPQYYFPTYENDTVLFQLEDKEGLIEPEDNFIIGEDGIDCKAIINGSILTDLVVRGYFD